MIHSRLISNENQFFAAMAKDLLLNLDCSTVRLKSHQSLDILRGFVGNLATYKHEEAVNALTTLGALMVQQPGDSSQRIGNELLELVKLPDLTLKAILSVIGDCLRAELATGRPITSQSFRIQAT